MQIETDVPMPTPIVRNGLGLRKLEIGHSLVVPKSRRSFLLSKASGYKAKHKAAGWDYTTRTVGDETRLWRIA